MFRILFKKIFVIILQTLLPFIRDVRQQLCVLPYVLGDAKRVVTTIAHQTYVDWKVKVYVTSNSLILSLLFCFNFIILPLNLAFVFTHAHTTHARTHARIDTSIYSSIALELCLASSSEVAVWCICMHVHM